MSRGPANRSLPAACDASGRARSGRAIPEGRGRALPTAPGALGRLPWPRLERCGQGVQLLRPAFTRRPPPTCRSSGPGPSPVRPSLGTMSVPTPSPHAHGACRVGRRTSVPCPRPIRTPMSVRPLGPGLCCGLIPSVVPGKARVPRSGDLSPASFRFHLTVDTLALN